MMTMENNLSRWHKHLRGQLEGGLDDLLADDVAFISPIVFTPQKGKDLTKLYLGAAGNTFSEGNKSSDGASLSPKFKYTKEVMSGDHMVLEFETELDGKYVNGVDIITWNESGKITEFKVMIRPLQAVNIMHQKMMKMLETMKG